MSNDFGNAAGLLAGVLDSAMDAIITMDEQQRIVLYNRAAEKIFGWSKLEILGQPLERLIPVHFRQAHAQHIEQYGNSGVPTRRMGARRVIYGLRANGEEFPMEASISRLDNPDGTLFTAIIRDITEICRLQEDEDKNHIQLRENQRKLLVAQHLASISYWQIDLNTNRMWWCDEASNVLGVDRALIGSTYDGFLQLIYPADRQAFEAARDAAVQAGLPLDTEFRIVTSCNEVRWIHLLGEIEGNDEQAHHRTGVIREITNRKTRDLAIARSAELLKRTGTLARVGGWEMVMETKTLHCTEEIYRVFGLDPTTAVMIKEPMRFYTPEVQKVLRAALKAAIKNAIPWDMEVPMITAKGQHIWVRTQGRATLQDGKVMSLFGALQDISEIKASEAALRLSNQELEAFSYSVSHDLRSPLNTINGFSNLLEKKLLGNESEKVQNYLSRIQAASKQMGQLIDDLLSLAQVSRAQLRNEPVDLSVIARTILNEWQERDPERQVMVHIESNLQAHGDGRLIRVVMENLLENAWKFTSHKAHAQISVGQIFDAAQLPTFFVRDNGAGFDMAYVEKIFSPFQRLHAVSEFAGAGIGLATVSRVIGRHRGRLWAESTPECGASFFFTLR